VRRRTGQELLGDAIFAVRICKHAAERWVDRIPAKVCRRLLRAGLNDGGDVFEAMINGLCRARFIGATRYGDGRLFSDGGLVYVVVPRERPEDPEARFLIVTCIPAHPRKPRDIARMDVITMEARRRQWRIQRSLLLSREADRECRGGHAA
jgi:hypothetical protein